MKSTTTPEPLQSGVLTSAADPMLSDAIAQTLRAPAQQRAQLFTRLVGEIEAFMSAHPEERPWTCKVYQGTDGSAIFRGGVGHSLVIDVDGCSFGPVREIGAPGWVSGTRSRVSIWNITAVSAWNSQPTPVVESVLPWRAA